MIQKYRTLSSSTKVIQKHGTLISLTNVIQKHRTLLGSGLGHKHKHRALAKTQMIKSKKKFFVSRQNVKCMVMVRKEKQNQ